jgi:beta-glucosidase
MSSGWRSARRRRRGSLVSRVIGALLLPVAMTAVASAAAQPAAGITARPGTASATTSASCPWLNQRLPVAGRVRLLMNHMTLADKIQMMYDGDANGYENAIPAQPSLCIPSLISEDGPAGVSGVAGAAGTVTQLPAPVDLGASWDTALARQYGVVNGEEHLGKGIEMTLGPGINIQRDPRWGRNFEMLSEDPQLTAQLGVAEIDGIQATGEIAQVKHFDAYNQETDRGSVNVNVSERAQHEIYMAPFYAATTQANVGAMMCAYNQENGQYSCQNPDLLTQTLRQDWGWDGIVASDFGATHSVVDSANAGLDVEQPSGTYYGQLQAAVESGQVSEATINEAVSDILTQMFRFGLFNHQPAGTPSTVVTTPAHAAFAQQAAEEGTVLLQNTGHILPLSSKTTSIAVIGADGSTDPLTASPVPSSAHVNAPYVISPLQGIKARAGSGVTVTSYSGTDPAQAAAAAAAAQVAIVFASNAESEGSDLPNITLQNDQDAYIEAVAAANPNTIVVLNTGGPVTMPWLSQVKAVLEAWYPGQQDGEALAELLFGDVDPSGHLAETFPQSLSQVPASTTATWPGQNGQVDYSEGIDVGYRYYEVNDETPLFPFGYGLSYTNFTFSHLRISRDSITSLGTVRVSATVTNTGSVAGSDVAQLYLGDPASSGEPPRQLEGFKRVTLQPGQSTTVSFALGDQDMSYWDDDTNGWVVPDGDFQVYVGDSSALANLPLRGSFQVAGTTGTRQATITAPGDVEAGKPVTVTTTLTGGGDLTVRGARLTLSAPAGWQVRPESPATAATLAPGQALTASWQVTATAAAQETVGRLAVTASYRAPGPGGGTGTSTAAALVTVDPLVTTVLTPESVLVPQGRSTPVTLENTDTSGYPVTFSWSTQPPAGSGVTVSPAGSAALAPGGTATTELTVTSSSSFDAPVTVPIGVTATAGSVTVPAPGAYLQVANPLGLTTSPASLELLETEPAQINVTTANNLGQAATATVRLATPGGWTVQPASATVTLAAGQSQQETFTVTPPAGSSGQAALRAVAEDSGGATTTLSLPATVGQPVAVVGEIGDTSNDQFALAPDHYAEYPATFPDDVDFTYGTGNPATDWSYIQPGPADSWAGSKSHTFTFSFSLAQAPASDLTFTGWLLDTQQSVPPTVQAGLNGTAIQAVALPAGGGDGYHWGDGQPNVDDGIKPSTFNVTLPAASLHAGQNSVTITTVSGSWLVYEAFGVWQAPSS